MRSKPVFPMSAFFPRNGNGRERTCFKRSCRQAFAEVLLYEPQLRVTEAVDVFDGLLAEAGVDGSDELVMFHGG